MGVSEKIWLTIIFGCKTEEGLFCGRNYYTGTLQLKEGGIIVSVNLLGKAKCILILPIF
jgi:hypothetical protein